MFLKKISLVSTTVFIGLSLLAQEIITDHPLIERYPDTNIYEASSFESEFEQFKFATETVSDEEVKNVITVEGKLSHIEYRPDEDANISLLKVYRNYESVLKRNNFDILLSCQQDDCGAYFLEYMLGKSTLWRHFSSASYTGDSYSKFFYISANKEIDGKQVYISYVLFEYGPMYIIQDILEVEMVDDSLLEMNLDFDDMSKQGRVVLGGLFFDSGKATLLDSSSESLALIAEYISKSKDQKFFIVGHTDSDGSHAFNLDLSEKRAMAVINKLVSDHQVNKKQLMAIGNGATSPIASNRNNNSKSKNRRVELVER